MVILDTLVFSPGLKVSLTAGGKRGTLACPHGGGGNLVLCRARSPARTSLLKSVYSVEQNCLLSSPLVIYLDYGQRKN